MPAARRAALRAVVLAAVVATSAFGLSSPALADDGATTGGATTGDVTTGDVTAGDTVVGQLLQAWPEHRDPDDAADAPLSWITGEDGASVRVDTGDVGNLPVGATVEVTVGEQVRDQATREDGLAPAREVLDAEVLAPAETPAAVSASAAYTDEVTVVLVEPPGTTRDATTVAQLVNAVNGPVADFWAGQSGGAVTLHAGAGAPGWIPTTAGCDDPAAMWAEVAADVGFTRTAGRHLLLYVPGYAGGQMPACAYGLAQVGTTNRTYGGYLYVRATATSVIAHELGHNFGLGHSSERQCDRALESGNCRTYSYYDLYDVMGASWEQVGSLNVVQAARIGLLPPAQELDLTAAGGGGTYLLSAVSGRSGTRAIRLTDPDGVAYWLELRTAAGQDSWLGTGANWPHLQTGVLLRRTGNASDSSLLLDGTPSAAANWGSDSLQALPVGAAVAVSDGDFVVTVLGVDPAGTALVRIGTAATTGSPVAEAYGRLGGATGPLGAPTAAETCGLPGGGCARTYANGAIYWSAATGAHAVRGAILDRYRAAGGPAAVGYPTADDGGTSTGDGAMAPFQGGAIYWSPSTGAHLVRGAILQRWAALGGQAGPLGYPTGDDAAGPGGYLTTFAGGTVYWSAATGAHMVRGALLAQYVALGGPGALGYPLADDGGAPGGGALVPVQGGDIYWSPSTGAHVVRGGILDAWRALGGQLGPLGYPTGDDAAVGDGGYLTTFAGGTVYWSAATGAHMVRGALLAQYVALGGPAALGYPLADDGGAAGGQGALVQVQGGDIYWSPSTGAHVVRGAILQKWRSVGGQLGPLGYPTGDDTPGVGGGYLTTFAGGTVYWSAATGAHMLRGAVLAQYLAAGGPAVLGYPTADDVVVVNGAVVRQASGG